MRLTAEAQRRGEKQAISGQLNKRSAISDQPKAPDKMTGHKSKSGPPPFPSPAGRGVFKPFSPREKGGDEGKTVLSSH